MNRILFLFFLIIVGSIRLNSQCAGLDANAGPDLFICDLNSQLQLQGSASGNYIRVFWTPTTGLSDPNVVDPFVNRPPGIYTYRLTVQGIDNRNIIVNGDFEGGNSGFTHEYQYGNPGGPFGPNNLSVGPNPMAYNNSWTPCGDHTSGMGNQLIVDGSTVAGRAVWCQQVPTTAGRMYQFIFSVQSVFPNNPGQLVVEVDGVGIGNVSAGGICSWNDFDACFTARSGLTEICIRETTGDGFGNDFAIDDIACYEKCEDYDDVEVEIVDLRALLDVANRPKCASEEFDLDGSLSSSGANISYEWSVTQGGSIVSSSGSRARGKGTGTYTLKVIYRRGNTYCEKVASIDIDVANDLVADITKAGQATCSFDTVRLNMEVLNGSGNYSYRWTPIGSIVSGQGSSTVNVLKPGVYTVIARDLDSGCEVEKSITVPADTSLPVSRITGDSLLNCKIQTINLNSNQTDTGRYLIQWILPNQTKVNDKTKLSESNAGTYRLIIQDKKNKCSDTALLDIVIDTLQPNVSLGTDLSINCKDTSLIINPNINNEPKQRQYSILFPDGSTKQDSVNNSLIINRAGRYIVELTNLTNFCSDRDTLDVLDLRANPIVQKSPDDIVNCKTRQISLQASSNLQDSVSYIWSTVDGRILNSRFSSNILIDKAGTYYVTVFDSTNYCSSLDSIKIKENFNAPIVSVTDTVITINCNQNSVFIDASASSKGTQYIFIWSSTNGSIGVGQGTDQLEALSAGNYKLVLIDTVSGCQDSVMVRVVPDQNKPILSATALDTLTCANKTVRLQATATSPTGGSLSYLWTGNAGQQIVNAASPNASVNAPGSYTLEVTDQSNGCKSIVVVNVQMDTVQPLAQAGSDLVWDCKTVSFTLQGNGSSNSGRVLYEWYDAMQTRISTTQSTSIQAPGKYILKIIDAKNLCVSYDTMNVIENQNRPTASIKQPEILNCLRDSVLLDGAASSQSTSIIYQWIALSGQINGRIDQSSASTQTPGRYILRVTDTSNFCVTEDTIVVLQNIAKPFIDAGSSQSLTCNKKQATFQAIGDPSLKVQWTTVNGNIIGNSNSLSVIADRVGWYYISVIDPVNGCEQIDSVELKLNQNVPSAIIKQVIQANCPGDFGFLILSGAEGGESPYLFEVDGNVVNDPSGKLDLSYGEHVIKLIDANGCELSEKIIIDEPQQIDVNLPPNVELQLGDDFSIKPTLSFPTDSVAWVRWNPKDNLSCDTCLETKVINFSKETEYEITVVDKRGCSTVAGIRLLVGDRGVWVPNVFSPNGDNINDYFYPTVTNKAAKSIRAMKIFDRWGELIFSRDQMEPNVPDLGWDGLYKGDKVIPGVYVFVIEVEWKNGQIEKLMGDITVIR